MALVAMTLACTDDLSPHHPYISAGETAFMHFCVEGRMNARAESENSLCEAIDHVYLFFFSDEEDDGQSRFTALCRAVPSDDQQAVLSFPIPVELEEGVGYRVLALANADHYAAEGFQSYGDFALSKIQAEQSDHSLETVRRLLSLYCPHALTSADSDRLPLMGETSDDDKFSFVKTGNGYEVSCGLVLSHSLCRIDVANLAASDMMIKGIMLCNFRDSYCPFAPESDAGQTVSPDFASEPFIDFPEPDSDNIQTLSSAFFCFPNTSTSPTSKDDSTTAVILSGYYKDPETGVFDSDPSFYRINIINDGESQHLAPNYIYNLSISQVKGRGKATLQQAFGEDPLAIIISSSDPNVKISGNVISIQAFHPELYNSFLSVPLQVKANTDVLAISNEDAEKLTFDISSDLQWPLEGLLDTKSYSGLLYCGNSFGSSGYVLTTAGSVIIPDCKTSAIPFNSTLFATVGCLGPDDPNINRNLTLTTTIAGNTYSSVYEVCIYARPIIIDDVILKLEDGYWLVCDRNVQISSPKSTLNPGYPDAAPVNHIKRQAYHYGSNAEMTIPFKLDSSGGNVAENKLHQHSIGYLFSQTLSSTEIDDVMEEWRNLYLDNDACRSLFYKEDNITQWTCPTRAVMTKQWPAKLACSKCRLFFVSDVCAFDASDSIPICCYLPFHIYNYTSKNTYPYELPYNNKAVSSKVYPSRYMTAEVFATSGSSSNNVFFCCMYDEYESTTETLVGSNLPSGSKSLSMIRLVRKLSDDELYEYKKNYLGYFGGTLRLNYCHKDTYSEWPNK